MRTLSKSLLGIFLLTFTTFSWAACPEGMKSNYKGECVLKDGKDIFSGDWSASTFMRSLNNKPYGYTVVPIPDVPTGKFAHRFEVRAGDCFHNEDWDDCPNNRERSELSITWKDGNYPGDDVWYQWWFKVDESWKNLWPVHVTLGQVHETESLGWCKGCPKRIMVFGVDAFSDGLYFDNHHSDIWGDAKLLSNEEMKGWHLITVHVRYSQDTDGVMEAWVDGKKKYGWQGQTTTTPLTYFKFGIYRNGVDNPSFFDDSFNKAGRLVDNHPDVGTSIVYYDEVVRSNTPLIENYDDSNIVMKGMRFIPPPVFSNGYTAVAEDARQYFPEDLGREATVGVLSTQAYETNTSATNKLGYIEFSGDGTNNLVKFNLVRMLVHSETSNDHSTPGRLMLEINKRDFPSIQDSSDCGSKWMDGSTELPPNWRFEFLNARYQIRNNCRFKMLTKGEQDKLWLLVNNIDRIVEIADAPVPKGTRPNYWLKLAAKIRAAAPDSFYR